MSKGYNLIQVGSFDVENFGDLLFPIVFEFEMKKRLQLNNLFLFSPIGGKMPFYNKKVYSATNLNSFINKHTVDGIVLGGGDTIRLDKKVLRDYPESFFPSFSMWQYPILLANMHEIPVVFNCPGVPLPFEEYQKIVEDSVSLASYVSVRDNNAKNTLTYASSLKVSTVLDSVNLIDEVYPKEKLSPIFRKLRAKNHIEESFVVIQASRLHKNDELFLNSMSFFINMLNKKYNLQVVLSPIGYVHDDLECLENLYSRIDKHRNIILRDKMSPEVMLSLFSHASCFIGTSLHGLITSNAYGVPILSLDILSRNKIHGYMKLCGFEERIVKNISEISDIFEKNYYKKPNYSLFYKERARLSKHFDKIADLIKKGGIKASSDGLSKVLEDFYNLTSNRSIFLSASYYIDEDTFTTRHILPSTPNTYVIENIKDTQRISLSFMEEGVFAIKKIKVMSEGDSIPFSIVGPILSNNNEKIYINPTIVLSSIKNLFSIRLFIDFERRSIETLVPMCLQYQNIINSTLWKRSKALRSLISRFHK